MFRDAALTRRQLFPTFAAGALSARAAASELRLITLRASDGASVYAWHYPAADKTLPAILLFHQAGSNHAEYATIAPRLAALGHHSIAIDQRSGGRMWGQSNRTAGEFGKDGDYLAALPDLEAALEWPPLQDFPLRSIVWGSSYSAALVFLLAAKHPSAVAAIMAFSPGEYLGADHSVRYAAAKVQVPVFITCAKDSEEVAAAQAIAGAVPGSLAVQFIPKSGGVHGSSTLRRDRNPVGSEENWQAVEKFLAGLARSRQVLNSGSPSNERHCMRLASATKTLPRQAFYALIALGASACFGQQRKSFDLNRGERLDSETVGTRSPS